MSEDNITSTRYNVLDVRELVYSNNQNYQDHAIVLICKEWNKAGRRRITVWDDDVKIFDVAKMLAPGDIILVHDRIANSVNTIVEIEY